MNLVFLSPALFSVLSRGNARDDLPRGDHAAMTEWRLRLWNALAGDNLPTNGKFAMELQGRRGGLLYAPMAVSSEE